MPRRTSDTSVLPVRAQPNPDIIKLFGRIKDLENRVLNYQTLIAKFKKTEKALHKINGRAMQALVFYEAEWRKVVGDTDVPEQAMNLVEGV